MEIEDIAPAFVDMAHEIVWCSVATVDTAGRPRTRVLHPIWEWDGRELVGWIGTGPTPTKRAHLNVTPNVSLSYWAPSQDTCQAECRADWVFEDNERTRIWELFKNAPAPVGYDPAMIPSWEGPTSPSFAALKLTPWRLRVFPGSVLLTGTGDVLNWRK